jgi:hypothetical protein
MSNIIFIFTPTKLKSKINFIALRINKKFTFYCDKLSIETKKSDTRPRPRSTQLRYILFEIFGKFFYCVRFLGCNKNQKFVFLSTRFSV